MPMITGWFERTPDCIPLPLTVGMLSTIANSLYTAVSGIVSREAAAITFLVSVSGISLFGIGAAFRGRVAGGVANFVFNKKQ